MPEIAEVARIVHFLRVHLVGKKIKRVDAPDDPLLFNKVGTTAAAFAKAMTGNTVVSAGTQGKYFWIAMQKPPHAVMHFGMTGWIHIKGTNTTYTKYYSKFKEEERELWPPKYCKFELETDSDPPVHIAFADPRRLARVRLVDCPADDIRKHSPLKENGPDPVVDKDIFTVEFLTKLLRSRNLSVKALMLDQKAISGIGNWVADEVLYQAEMHPEQNSREMSEEDIQNLYDKIMEVCTVACEKLGYTDDFPPHWLFKKRWAKGAKDATGPKGEKLAFITVGGRTSCYDPLRQKIKRKDGTVEEPVLEEETDEKKSTKGAKKAAPAKKSTAAPKKTASKSKKRTVKKEETSDEDDNEEEEHVDEADDTEDKARVEDLPIRRNNPKRRRQSGHEEMSVKEEEDVNSQAVVDPKPKAKRGRVAGSKPKVEEEAEVESKEAEKAPLGRRLSTRKRTTS